MSKHQPEIVRLPDVAAVQRAAAERVVALANAQVAATGRFLIALSGGNTPRGLHTLLAQEPLRSQIPWGQVWVVWGDERYVPADHPDSSYLMARETLLEHVPIPSEQIYPVPTYYADPVESAAIYEQQIQALLAANGNQIDLVLLGMGPDGHTASLFPHHPALAAPAERLVVAIDNSPKPPPRRITLTVAALNRAAHTLVLVTGADKAETLREVLEGPADPQRLPIQLIQPPHGSVTWLVDAAAATYLSAG